MRDITVFVFVCQSLFQCHHFLTSAGELTHMTKKLRSVNVQNHILRMPLAVATLMSSRR